MNETTSNFELPPLEWTLIKIVQSAIFSGVIVSTVIGNFIALWAFFRYPKDLRSPTHYFLANLALADFLVGVLSLPYLAVFSVTLRWYFGHWWCIGWTVGHFWFCSSSILSTLAVCVERFIGVRYPLKHLRMMNTRTILSMICGVWVLAGILSALPLAIWPETRSEKPLDCKVNLRTGHVVVASVGIFHLPATAMVILYGGIYRAATAPMKQMREISTQNAKEQRSKQVRLAKKLSFLVGFLIISYLPMFSVFLALGFDPTFCSLEFFILLAWLRYFNSTVNPVIYAFSVPGYKRAFRAMFCSRSGSDDGQSGRNEMNNSSSTYTSNASMKRSTREKTRTTDA